MKMVDELYFDLLSGNPDFTNRCANPTQMIDEL